MPAGQYPFIDIAVHSRIRERFAAGQALVLFSRDLGAVLWANGSGARLFGFDTVYEFMDEGAAGKPIVLRQLAAAANRIATESSDQVLTIRIASGLRHQARIATLGDVTLKDGTSALLLSADSDAPAHSAANRAGRIIDGFGGTDTHVAVLDSSGAVLAASPSFQRLAMEPTVCRDLASDVARETGRLVKKMISTARGPIPAAIARLTDEPALNLVFVVETDAVAEADTVARTDPDTKEPDEPRPAKPPVRMPHINAWYFNPPADSPGEARPTGEGTEDDEPRETVSVDTAGGAGRPAGDDAEIAVDESGETENAQTGVDREPGQTAVADDESAFVFDPAPRVTRFVWKIDAEGRFSALSPDFAAAVGPNAANVVGRRFDDVTRVFAMDSDGTVASLLRRRDTWSGKTVFWPVQGTARAVPVDLAALPTYTRDRRFDGFRGFGVVRIGDAIDDPEAIGLSLAPAQAAEPDEPVGTEQGEPETDAGPQPRIEDTLPHTDGREPTDRQNGEPPLERMAEDVAKPHDEDAGEPSPADPFRGEPPALRIVPTPGRRESDKIIHLEERRARDGLSTGEQAAFREIGKRLATTFGRARRKTEKGAEPQTDPESASTTAGTGNAAETREAGSGQTAVEAAAAAGEPANAPDLPAAGDSAPSRTRSEPFAPAAPRTDRGAATASEARTHLTETIPSAFAALPSKTDPQGLDVTVIDELPVALLVHSGETVDHVNQEFLTLTGYDTLDAFTGAGGLSVLFAGQDYDGQAGLAPAGTLTLIAAEGAEIPVRARLQSIRWQHRPALMLSIAAVQRTADAPMADDATTRPAPDADTDADAAEHQSVAPPAGLDEEKDDALSLRVEVDELRAILETATDGVVILGETGEIRSMNKSASALFNYDGPDILGAPFAKLFAHESQRAVMDYLAGLSDHGVASVLNDGREVIGREASGGFLPLFMTIGRLPRSNGYCAVMRDITQWKRTEDDLRDAKRAAETANSHKSAFLARVSHEIRTPLNAIIGFSEMMAEQRFGPIGSPRYLEYAHDIGRSGKHVLDIVNDLLDISKIEAGEMEIEFSAVALNDAVADAVSLLQPQANSQRVIVRTSLSSSVPDVVADRRSIKQIVLNLLSNAIRFTPSGGQIVLSTSYEARGNVVLRMRDTGIGMTRTELDQAMKPFRQVSAQSRKRGDGTGLGLPLTKAMTEANRAQFEIHSVPDEGTLVEITFPAQRVLAG